jgi:hypothetical protein
MPDDLQVPVGKSNLARLLWNVMAFKTSVGEAGQPCDPFQKKCPAGQVGNSTISRLSSKCTAHFGMSYLGGAHYPTASLLLQLCHLPQKVNKL